LKALDGQLLTFGAVSDHVHLLYCHPKDHTIIEVVGKVKANSSRWMKGQGSVYTGFQWQAGYGAFSVSASRVGAVRRYILTQEEQHRKQSFQDEFRKFLKEYRIAYDERYLWD
jgi:REP element-mobilizing transposase RayT